MVCGIELNIALSMLGCNTKMNSVGLCDRSVNVPLGTVHATAAAGAAACRHVKLWRGCGALLDDNR